MRWSVISLLLRDFSLSSLSSAVIPSGAMFRLCRNFAQSRDLLFIRLVTMPHVPFCRQILPGRISALNQPRFLGATPPLDLLLPINRLVDVVERLEINQPMTSILLRETLDRPVLVLEYPPFQAVAYPRIEYRRLARHHVYEIAMALHSRSLDFAAVSLREAAAPLGMTISRGAAQYKPSADPANSPQPCPALRSGPVIHSNSVAYSTLSLTQPCHPERRNEAQPPRSTVEGPASRSKSLVLKLG
jgi:hypothetical protein